MDYPYTIVKTENIKIFYDILVSFGYVPFHFNLTRFIEDHISSDPIYVVINDCTRFGALCFYEKGDMSKDIKRLFIKDNYRFLCKAAEYKKCSEY